MKRRVVLGAINCYSRRFSLSVEFLAARILSDPGIARKIRVIKKIYPYQTTPKKIIQQVLGVSADLVGFSCYVWNISQILEVSSAIKKNSPNTLIILGGPETAGRGGKILEEHLYIDGVVMGEGEETLAQVLAGWLQHDKLDPVPGIAVRQGKQIYIGPPRPLTEDLSKIPSPYGNLKFSAKNKSAMMPLQTVRGCNRKCFYCYYGKSFSTIRFFPLERVEEDLEKIKKAGFQTIGIIDPSFFCNKDHAAGVIRIISKKGLLFGVEANSEDLDEKSIDLLVSSSCYQVNFGVQSTNPKTQKLCGRSADLKLFETNLRRLAQKCPGINIYLDLIYGLPGDTIDDFLNSFDFASSLPVDKVHAYRLLALPGTPFYERPEKWGIRFDPNPPYWVYKTCSFFHEDKRNIPLANNCMGYWFSSHFLRIVSRYILEKIADPPSQFFIKIMTWEGKRKKMTFTSDINNQLKISRLSDLRYMLSGVKHIYPDIFSNQELEFIEEWYKFQLYLYRLKQKTPPRTNDQQVSDNGEMLWKRSENLLIGHFRIKPNLDSDNMVIGPLTEKSRRFALQKDSQGIIRIYEVSEGIEKLLKYFRQPKVLKSYLTAPGNESAVERHIRIQYAKEKGFIRAVKRGKEINPNPDK
jgi:uncharacterized Fe-S cluster-containing radical SAM superfamily protein